MINKYLNQKIALQFSGGKDSLACLFLLKDYWESITVVWVNTGAAFPETLKQMEFIKSIVPNFLEVNSNQPLSIEMNGYPSDVIDSWATPLGRLIDKSEIKKMQAPFDCCNTNLWQPMQRAMEGFTVIIRGQRNDEKKKSPIRSGYEENGTTYLFPLEDWTEEDVLGFLKKEGIPLPDNYNYFNSSLDCWSCTAYLKENIGKNEYMRILHPDLHEKRQFALKDIIDSVSTELDMMKAYYAN
jgi:phosphoadenosine phosphosulfate reductase